MATNTVEYKLLLNDKKFLSALRNATAQTDKLKKGVQKTSSGFGGLGKLVGGLAIGGTIAMIGKSVFDLGTEMEQTRVAFGTFLKSADKGNKLIAELNQFANITPFNNAEIIKSGRLLLSAGIEADEVVNQLKAIGDVSAGANVPITELSAIFQKATNKGKLQAEELNQFSERGIPILGELAKMFGTTKEGVLKLGSQGKISSKHMNKAFENMTSKGGIFFNLMETQSETVGGRISTLVGTLETIGIGLGEFLLPVIGKITDGLLAFVQFVQNNVGGLTKVFQPLFDVIIAPFKLVWDLIKGIAEAFGVTSAEGVTLADVFTVIGNVLEVLSFPLKLIYTLFKFLFDAFVGGVKSIVKLVKGSERLMNVFRSLKHLFAGTVNAIVNGFVSLKDNAVAILGGLSDLLIGFFTMDIKQVAKGIQALKKPFTDAGKSAKEGFAKGVTSGKITTKDFFADDKKESEKTGGMSDLTKLSTGAGAGQSMTAGSKTKKSGLGSGLSEVKGTKAVNLTINIGNLVEKFDVVTETIQGGANTVKDEIVRALLGAVNDVNVIADAQ